MSQRLKRDKFFDIKKGYIKKACLFLLLAFYCHSLSSFEQEELVLTASFLASLPIIIAKQRKNDSTQLGGIKIPGDVSPRVRKELTTYFRNNINQHLSQDCRFAVSRENQVRGRQLTRAWDLGCTYFTGGQKWGGHGGAGEPNNAYAEPSKLLLTSPRVKITEL